MKKVLCIAIALVLAVAAFAVPVSAASPKEELAATVKAAIPKGYNDRFVATVDNVLKQIDVSKDQADQVTAIINETISKIKDKGLSLHEYTKDEVAYILAQFGKACSVLNLTYKVVAKKNAVHTGDVVCELYYNGALVGTIDGDAGVKQTGADVSGAVFALAIAGGVVLLAASSVFVFKKSAVKA